MQMPKDVNDLLLFRLLQGMQEQWMNITDLIKGLRNLHDVEKAPEEALQYLKWIVGLTKSLDFLTGNLSERVLRRIIHLAPKIWQYKGTPKGFVEILEIITAYEVRLLDWFYFRTILGEMEIFHADDPVDTWLLDASGMDSNIFPDGLEVSENTNMDVLPSDMPDPWYYIGIQGAALFDIFQIINGVLEHDQTNGNDSGGQFAYYLPLNELDEISMGAVFQLAPNPVTINDRPWFIAMCDGVKRYVLRWSQNDIVLMDHTETIQGVPANFKFVEGTDYRIYMKKDANGVSVTINGFQVFNQVSISGFSAYLQNGYWFGFWDNRENQNWLAYWDDVGPAPKIQFDLTSLLGTTEAVPHTIRVKYLPKNAIRTVYSQWTGTKNVCYVNDAFGQDLPIETDNLNNFKVGVDPDEFSSDLYVVDDGSLDRDLVQNLVKVMRPAGERFFIRWMDFIDTFKHTYDIWTSISGNYSIDETNKWMQLDGSSQVLSNMPNDSEWQNIIKQWKFYVDTIPHTGIDFLFNYVSATEHLMVRFLPTGITHKLQLGYQDTGGFSQIGSDYDFPLKIRANQSYTLAVHTQLVTIHRVWPDGEDEPDTPPYWWDDVMGAIDPWPPDSWPPDIPDIYTIRILVYFDGNLIFDTLVSNDPYGVDDPVSEKGKVGVINKDASNYAFIESVTVSQCPFEFNRIGPPIDGEPLNTNNCLVEETFEMDIE